MGVLHFVAFGHHPGWFDKLTNRGRYVPGLPVGRSYRTGSVSLQHSLQRDRATPTQR